jgi:hypothetical protein
LQKVLLGACLKCVFSFSAKQFYKLKRSLQRVNEHQQCKSNAAWEEKGLFSMRLITECRENVVFTLIFRSVRRRINFHQQHKHFALFAVLYVVYSTLIAIEHNGDGSWQMPLILFHIAVFIFIVGSCELVFIGFKKYKSFEARCKAVSRCISCYGVAFTIVYMCELYEHNVHF